VSEMTRYKQGTGFGALYFEALYFEANCTAYFNAGAGAILTYFIFNLGADRDDHCLSPHITLGCGCWTARKEPEVPLWSTATSAMAELR
jgi:hypothetical protein